MIKNNAQENKYIRDIIKPVLDDLYGNDALLFENDLSERCIAFRFVYYLQNVLSQKDEYKEYFADCDYNSHCEYDEEKKEWVRKNGKPINLEERDDADGSAASVGRFIDVIVHKRLAELGSDLICFELKKWNNKTAEGMDKDINNLKELTSTYGYKYGFHIIFGEVKEDTEIEVFQFGESLDKNELF